MHRRVQTDRPARAGKGQTTIDYVLVLAVVLLIALVALGLSGTWPDFALNSRNQQAVSFWRDQVRPITIPEAHYDMSDHKLYFTMQTQIDEPIVVRNMYLDTKQVSIWKYYTTGSPVVQCTSNTCYTPACTCNDALNPRRRERTVSGDLSLVGIDPGCRQNGAYARMPVWLTYYRPSEPTKILNENTTIDLVFDCQP